MNKELFSYISILIALMVGALYYNNLIQSPIITSLNSIQSTYYNSIKFVDDAISKHFFQATQIVELKAELEQYENNHLVMKQLASEINDLYDENHSTIKLSPKVELIRTISYEKFGNLNRLWIDFPDYNSSKIYGLIYKEFVAGIVIEQNDKPLALLNRDLKCAYAVYIGENRAPGIAHGNNSEFLVVDFIPEWIEINPGDEVITSGLDNIFFKGLKVGKVISITKSQGYKSAVVEQYYKANEPSYYHLIRSVK